MDEKTFREKYGSLWDAAENPSNTPATNEVLGDINKRLENMYDDSAPTPPPTFGSAGSTAGSMMGQPIGANAAIRVAEPFIDAAPIPPWLKLAGKAAVGYYGGKVGGGIFAGAGKAALAPLDKENTATPGENFASGYEEGNEASSGPLNMLNVPFVPSKGQAYKTSQTTKEIGQEILGTHRSNSPQTLVEKALDYIKPGVKGRYNPEEQVMMGKGIGDSLASEPITVKNIQDLQMQEAGKPLSNAFMAQPGSNPHSFIITGQHGKTRDKNLAIAEEVKNRVGNVNVPGSIFEEIMPKVPGVSIEKRPQINAVETANLWGPTMKKAKDEAMAHYYKGLHDLTILGRDSVTGQKIEVNFPRLSHAFHAAAKERAGSADYETVFKKIMTEADSNDPYAAPLARALVYGESIPVEDLPKLRPYITHIANPKAHGQNVGGVQTLATVLDEEVNKRLGSSLPDFVKIYNNNNVIYDRISPHVSWDTLPGQATTQSNAYFNKRVTEPQLKWSHFAGDNPEFLINAARASDDFKGLLTPQTAQEVEKLSPTIRQWRLNKLFSEGQGEKQGTSALLGLVNKWEEMDRLTAAATVGEENVRKVNILMATAKKVALSGGANPEKIMHLGRALMVAGAGATAGYALTGGSPQGGLGGATFSSALYYALAYGYPALRSKIISSPKLMEQAIKGVHLKPVSRTAQAALAQWIGETGLGDQLKDEYVQFSQWAQKTGGTVSEYFKQRETGKLPLNPPQKLETPLGEGEVQVNPHEDMDTYLQQFGQ